MNSLQAKKILVIGGTSGIGHMVANMAVQAGASVVITGRDPEKLARVLGEFESAKQPVTGFCFDAAEPDGAEALFKKVGQIDGLVSMAGGFMGGGFIDAPYETIHKAVDEKLFANLRIARAASSRMLDSGAMVFTSGCGGKPDNASGAIIGNDAIRTMVAGLAVELAPRVRVNAVAPTWMKTPLWRHMTAEQIADTDRYFCEQIPLGRTARIEEVAEAYLFLLTHTFMTGQTLNVDGGVSLR